MMGAGGTDRTQTKSNEPDCSQRVTEHRIACRGVWGHSPHQIK
jgi:hypothetical protein